jgi:DNA invertase Pin-like site-specific DNA recombinase
MKVALYARVSKKTNPKKEKDKLENARREQDTENQLIQLRKYCESQGWIVFHEYVDRASGKNSDRDKFKQLFQDAYQHKFDLILFWSLDRFSREGVFETLQHLQKLSSYKVEWKSFTEQYLDSCGFFKDAVLAILATVAKQERIRISERTIAGLERAREAGKIMGRPEVVCDMDLLLKYRTVDKFSIRQIAILLKINKNVVMRRLQEYDKANPQTKAEDNQEIIIETFQEDN